MTAETIEKMGEQIRQGIPLRRHGEPADMAGIALYLASKAGSYVTGCVVDVNGGIRGSNLDMGIPDLE